MPDDAIPTVITRPLPNAVVYNLSRAGQVRITLPAGSVWSSGLHWHETHTEYLTVIRGRVHVRLGDDERIIDAADDRGAGPPEIKVDRGVWHEWSRAEPDGPDDVVVIEKTDPADNEKAVFFWNLNGVILEAVRSADDPAAMWHRFLPPRLKGLLLDLWISLNLFIIFHHLDNFPVFLNLRGSAIRCGPDLTQRFAPDRILNALDMLCSHLVLMAASWVGWAVGLEPVRRKFTPASPYHAWWAARGSSRKRKSA